MKNTKFFPLIVVSMVAVLGVLFLSTAAPAKADDGDNICYNYSDPSVEYGACTGDSEVDPSDESQCRTEETSCPKNQYFAGFYCEPPWQMDGILCSKKVQGQTVYSVPVFFSVTFDYNKAPSDKNHCHRPTGSSLGVPSQLMNDFNAQFPELLEASSSGYTYTDRPYSLVCEEGDPVNGQCQTAYVCNEDPTEEPTEQVTEQPTERATEPVVTPTATRTPPDKPGGTQYVPCDGSQAKKDVYVGLPDVIVIDGVTLYSWEYYKSHWTEITATCPGLQTATPGTPDDQATPVAPPEDKPATGEGLSPSLWDLIADFFKWLGL